MSEIQVIIPLAVLAGAKDLTPEGIVNFLQEAADRSTLVSQANMRITVLENTIKSIGTNLEAIWEGACTEFDRAQEIRKFINNLKSFEAKGINE